MPALDAIARHADELAAWRRDFHAHPEIGFEEARTSGIATDRLENRGIEMRRGVGRIGVVRRRGAADRREPADARDRAARRGVGSVPR